MVPTLVVVTGMLDVPLNAWVGAMPVEMIWKDVEFAIDVGAVPVITIEKLVDVDTGAVPELVVTLEEGEPVLNPVARRRWSGISTARRAKLHCVPGLWTESRPRFNAT